MVNEMDTELYTRLGEIKATQEHMLRLLEERNIKQDEISRRVSAVESKINYAAGAVLMISAFLGVTIDSILKKIGFR